MSFPIVHLYVADRVADAWQLPDGKAALLLLGALAPDGVHYREAYIGAEMKNIGAAKKISHLCPESDELWGQVTDNEGWAAKAVRFLQEYPHDYIAAGYVVHVLTDIYNNVSIWEDFRTAHPEEAEKGYHSTYHQDLAHIDLRLYQEPQTARITALLRDAQGRDFPGLVSAEEICAIRDNIVYTGYANRPPADTGQNLFVTYEQVLQFIDEAAAFALARLPVI